MTSPPSGCQRDFHPQAVEHARHTKKTSHLLQVVGRSLNSPPPKSAHKQPAASGSRWEWPGRATVQKEGLIAIAFSTVERTHHHCAASVFMALYSSSGSGDCDTPTVATAFHCPSRFTKVSMSDRGWSVRPGTDVPPTTQTVLSAFDTLRLPRRRIDAPAHPILQSRVLHPLFPFVNESE